MADTERATATLLSLLADNAAGEISAQDLRDALVSCLGGYASIYVIDGAAAQAVSATPTKLTAFAADGPYLGATPAHASDQITIGVTGVYRVDFAATISGDAATYTFRLRKNGSAEGTLAAAATLAASATGAAAFSGLVSLTANDVLTVYAAAGGAANLTVSHACLSVKRIG